MIASRISFLPCPAFVTSTPHDQSSHMFPWASYTWNPSARSQTTGGWPRMENGSLSLIIWRMGSDSFTGRAGETILRNLVFTGLTGRGSMENSFEAISGSLGDGWTFFCNLKPFKNGSLLKEV